ncbi:TrkH family potassium uptake protein [Rothia sp. CCM 9417]|uniref:TrkH family potassium uptake protein n=1 Tax=Rothia sp. CCM 9417 TaxID=3402657 RepID=UPI003AE81344
MLRSSRINPQRSVFYGFLSVILMGTVLLLLPISHLDPSSTRVIDNLFTAVSATCVTGLSTVDTPNYWSNTGLVIILILIQVGGLGVMTLATAIGASLQGRHLAFSAKLRASAEVRGNGLFNMRKAVLGIVKTSLLFEACGALALTLRFHWGYDMPLGQATWYGVFHAVSAFNNAGFALYSDSLMGFNHDPFILLPISFLIILGGLGFPVLMQLRRYGSNRRLWRMGTKLVIYGTLLLLSLGTLGFAILEWNNPGTLGPMSASQKILNSFAQSVSTRTAGFSNLDIAQFHPATTMFVDLWMFIGGGPAGTAGGIKITTFGVLFFLMLAEIRGQGAVNIFGKRLSRSVHREATTVLLLGCAFVFISIFALALITDFTSDQLTFEAISAFATVGLSTGITPMMPDAGKVILIVLMVIGRVGPVTAAAAFAYRRKPVNYEFPKERPIIG